MKSNRRIAQTLVVFSFVVMTGCGSNHFSGTSTTAPGAPLGGKVMGGQQPISQATIQLYAVGTTGDGSASTPLLNTTVTTNSTGAFSVASSDYSCPSSSTLVYLTATQGNPGLTTGTNNTAISQMLALGACGSLGSLPGVNITEVTTVATIAALYPYMTSYSAIGYNSTSGTGATATATISTCDVVGVTVTYAGSGYTAAPTVTFTPTSGGSGAVAYTTTTGSSPTETVASVVMTNPGSGYSAAPSVTFSTPTGTSPAVAMGTATMDSCVTGYAITNAGSGYTSAPEVTFSGGGGEGAAATATVSGGAVTGITITNAGEGYTSAPTISISGPTTGGDSQKLTLAFSAVNEYVNIQYGQTPGSTLPSGYYASATEINTLADALAGCVNSFGPTTSGCSNLFTYATVGGTAPTDTAGAALNILNNPTSNVTNICNLATTSAPFQPTLSCTTGNPSYWTLPIIASEPTLPLSLPATGTYTITLASNSALAWDNKRSTGQGFNNSADGIYICPTGSGCSGTFVASEQQFAFTAEGNGTYIITSVNSGGELLTFGANPGMVSQDSGFTTGSDNWVWTIVPASSGSGYLLYDNWTPGQPADAKGNGSTVASGNLLYADTYSGGSSQIWNITPSTGNSCPVITPEIWTSISGWQNVSSLSVPAGVEVSLSGAPTAVGSWSWTGNGNGTSWSSSSMQNNNVPLSTGTNTFTATYSNSCGTPSTQTYTVNVGQPTLTASSCDILSTAGTPCGAAYSLTRRMFAAYTGNLFQLSCASCSPTTMNIGSSSTTGEVSVAAATSYCSTAPSSCYISEIYDQTGNGDNLTSSSGSMALYQTSPYNGLPVLQTTAPSPTTTDTYTNTATAATTFYRSAASNIPTGNPSSGLSVYYVRSNYGLLSTAGDFGMVDATTAGGSQGTGHRFSLAYSALNGSAVNTTGSYYCVDTEISTTATSNYMTCGATGTAPTINLAVATSLPSPPLFTEIGKYTFGSGTTGAISVEVADATQGGLTTVASNVTPTVTPNLVGEIALAEAGNGNIAISSFQEGAIIPSTITADATLQANIAAFYGQPTLTSYSTTGNYQGPGDMTPGAAGWWGLRAYNNAYAASLGAAIQVQPTGGSSTTINVTATGDLNVAAAQAACQNTVCFITEFYDQTGGGHNMTQSNINYQPVLEFNCANGSKVCAFYSTLSSGNQVGFQTTLDASIPQPFTLNGVWNKTNALYPSVAAVLSSFFQGTPNEDYANFGPQINEQSQTVVTGGQNNAQPAHSYVFQSMTSEFNGVTASPYSPVYINGIESTFNPSGSGGTASEGFGPKIDMGQNPGGGQTIMGFIQEAGVWPSGLSAATVSSLSNNQRAYWQF